MASGEERVILCERGIRTFETSTRNTLDLGGMLAVRPLTHLPLMVDPSHAAGRADLVEGLGRLHAETGGRPAELFRFRRELVRAGPAPGLGLPLLRD